MDYYKINVPPHLIVLVQQRQLEKEFRDFLFAKHLFRNGTIYNYSTNRLSNLLSWSRTKTKRLVEIWLNNDWCYFDNGHLRFRNAFKIYKALTNHISKKKATLYLQKKSSKDIFTQINLNLLKTKLSHIKAAIDTKRNLIFPENYKDYKNALKKEKRFKRSLTNDALSYSMRTSLICLGKFINRSSVTAQRRIKLLKEDKLIHTKTAVTPICKMSSGVRLSDYYDIGYIFVKDGWLYKRESNEYSITKKYGYLER